MNWDGQLVNGTRNTTGEGVRFTHTRRDNSKNFRVRFASSIITMMGWQTGDRIGMRWSRADRLLSFYRIPPKDPSGAFSLKRANDTPNSCAYLEVNPKAIPDKDIDIRKIIDSLCATLAEPEYRKSSDGLLVEMTDSPDVGVGCEGSKA